ncbi:CRE-LGC-10 protein [Aphelenchoides avenae]|nr:CRE-LGC-10 protein [Aphelenchus avenae]
MSIVLGILIEMNQKEQLVSFVISHTQRWYDNRLTWNPRHFNGMRELTVPRRLLWQPKIIVYNSMNTMDMLPENRYDVRVRHDGLVKINIPQFVSCSCQLSVERFPFDTQVCSVALASPLLTVREMVANALPPPKDSYFAGNAEFNLENVTVRNLRYTEEGEHRVELRRRPMFYVVVVIVPTSLITALSTLGIFAPGSSSSPQNEKVSLGLGSLLAMTVLLGIVADSMPKSTSTSLLGQYIIAILVQSSIAVGVSMCVVSLRRRLTTNGGYPCACVYWIMCLQPKIFPRTRREALKSTPSSAHFPNVDRWRGSGLSSTSDYLRTQRAISLRKSMKTTARANDSGPDRNMIKITYLPQGATEILKLLCELAESQIIVREKFQQDHVRVRITKEWSRIFTRLDYVFLLLFQMLNVGTLVHFMHYAWLPSPQVDFSSQDRFFLDLSHSNTLVPAR